MSKIFITGDPNWNNESFICKYLKSMVNSKKDSLISGYQDGVERTSVFYSKLLGIQTYQVLCPNEYDYHCDDFLRLSYMVNICNPDKIIIFHNDISNSPDIVKYIDIISKTKNIEIIILSTFCNK